MHFVAKLNFLVSHLFLERGKDMFSFTSSHPLFASWHSTSRDQLVLTNSHCACLLFSEWPVQLSHSLLFVSKAVYQGRYSQVCVGYTSCFHALHSWSIRSKFLSSVAVLYVCLSALCHSSCTGCWSCLSTYTHSAMYIPPAL